MQSTETMTLRLPGPIKSRLERLAMATERTKAYLAAKAIEEYLNSQEWQIKAIQEAIVEADSPKAKFIDHEDVVGRVKKRVSLRKDKRR